MTLTVTELVLATLAVLVLLDVVTEARFAGEDLLRDDRALAAGVGHDLLDRGRLLGECSNLAREMANEPGNTLTPTEFAKRSEKIVAGTGLSFDVLDEKQIAALGMGMAVLLLVAFVPWLGISILALLQFFALGASVGSRFGRALPPHTA